MPGHGTVPRGSFGSPLLGTLRDPARRQRALGDDVVVLALVLNEELDRLIRSSSVSGMRPSKPSISEASRNVSLFRVRQTARLRDAR